MKLWRWSPGCANHLRILEIPIAHLPTKAADTECTWEAGGTGLPKLVGDQLLPWCWISSCQTWSCRFGTCPVGFQYCFGPAFPCYLSSRNERYSVLLYTKNTELFFYITGTQSQEFITALGMWIYEDARSWAECILHYEMATSLRKPSVNVLIWVYVFQDSVPSRGSVLDSCGTFRSGA